MRGERQNCDRKKHRQRARHHTEEPFCHGLALFKKVSLISFPINHRLCSSDRLYFTGEAFIMLNSTLTARRILFNIAFVAAFVCSVFVGARAQTQDPAERQHALDVYESQNMVAALPLLEKVALAYPNDAVVLSRLGFAIYANSVDEKNPATRQKMRDRARSILLKSQSLGDNSNLTKMALDTLSGQDTTQIPFSNIQAAEVLIRDGEAAFMRGDWDKAIAAYKRALESDPNLYSAALYAGDSEFKKAMVSTDPQFRNTHFDAA